MTIPYDTRTDEDIRFLPGLARCAGAFASDDVGKGGGCLVGELRRLARRLNRPGWSSERVSRSRRAASAVPALVPGNAQASRLHHAAAALDQPSMPQGKTLAAPDLEVLRVWIEAGAPALSLAESASPEDARCQHSLCRPVSITIPDPDLAVDIDEDRFAIIGMSRHRKLLVVIHT